MSRYINSLAVVFVLAMAMSVSAQESTTTEAAESAGEVTTGTISEIENELSMGESVDETPQIGQPYTAEVIGAWELRCIRTEEENDPCQLYQLLEDDNGSSVAEFSMFRLPEGGQAMAGATVIVPLETALPQQLTISVDGAPGKRYPYAFCNSVGCYARIGLTSDEIDAFKHGNEAAVTIVPALAPDQKVVVMLSLDGFTASYEKVSVLEP